MMTRTLTWYRGLSAREQRLIAAMLIVALPLLAWLLVVRPLDGALTDAKIRQGEAVARHGRILARIDAIQSGAARAVGASASTATLDLIVAEAASQRGLTLDANTAAGSDAVTISIVRARADAVVAWLAEFENQSIVIEDMRMTQSDDATVSLTARLRRSGT